SRACVGCPPGCPVAVVAGTARGGVWRRGWADGSPEHAASSASAATTSAALRRAIRVLARASCGRIEASYTIDSTSPMRLQKIVKTAIRTIHVARLFPIADHAA